MIRLFAVLILSWLLIWLLEKKDLRVLGIVPNKQRLFDFVLFFFVTVLCCAAGFFIRWQWGTEKWGIHPALNIPLIFSGAWVTMLMLLFEELLFRGVLLYLLIKKLGSTRAIVVSSLIFGIHQWFSFGVWGNAQQMLVVFLVTAVMGALLAYAFAKTYSLYIPVAIHFGWNITYGLIFSKGPVVNGILLPVPTQPGDGSNAVAIGFIFSVLSVLLVNFLLLKRHPQATMQG